MQVILSSPYGPQVFYFLLWLIDFLKLSVKGIMVSLVSHERARHDGFPIAILISILDNHDKSHRRDIGIYVIF